MFVRIGLNKVSSGAKKGQMRIIRPAMPTYQYACPDCGTEFEKFQKFTDEPVKKCPNCGKKKVYRVVSKVAVSFKGSGWYITDSKSNNSAGATPKKDGDKTEADKTETKAAETTTEAKSADSTDTSAKTETATKDSGSSGESSAKDTKKKDKAAKK